MESGTNHPGSGDSNRDTKANALHLIDGLLAEARKRDTSTEIDKPQTDLERAQANIATINALAQRPELRSYFESNRLSAITIASRITLGLAPIPGFGFALPGISDKSIHTSGSGTTYVDGRGNITSLSDPERLSEINDKRMVKKIGSMTPRQILEQFKKGIR